MNYIDEGEGRAIVFLHGWGGCTESFAAVANAFKRDFRVIRFDFAGFGKSPPPNCVWGVDDYALDVAGNIIQLGLDNVTLVCHSFGARIGTILAAKYPHLVNKLVLTGAAGIKPRFSMKKFFKILTYKTLKKLFPKKIERLRKMFGSCDYLAAGGMRDTMVKVVSEDLTPYLNSISCPTVIFHGKKDKETPVYMAKILHKRIRDSGLILVDGGHFAYVEQSYLFVKVLDSFLT